ncbi:GNAT family N-acetyltransferase [Pseudodonghicola flavimaris]|uniref:GNAT family N-acetyltransferase n=1 Tax=Pseudodonghicola flavimaris TaxID=3050036 RepID=A0ABT7F542_9RHOB|nr:GNAT family N-acetyltransferase [Pseudodonghicola flavimaris]MDK3019735.1 GNAT family N-acetyltransferase [Pseudodonghicola flavimaris]
MPDVTLAPLPRDRLDLIAHLSLPPEQHQFAFPPVTAMARADGQRDGHMILEGDAVVGFFGIDPGYAEAHDFAEAGSIGLRMFSIDHRAQGRGIATAASRALQPYLRAQYPGVAICYLTVNHRNPHAKSAYLKGGFVDIGADYLGGASGPQHILRLALSDPAG